MSSQPVFVYCNYYFNSWLKNSQAAFVRVWISCCGTVVVALTQCLLVILSTSSCRMWFLIWATVFELPSWTNGRASNNWRQHFGLWSVSVILLLFKKYVILRRGNPLLMFTCCFPPGKHRFIKLGSEPAAGGGGDHWYSGFGPPLWGSVHQRVGLLNSFTWFNSGHYETKMPPPDLMTLWLHCDLEMALLWSTACLKNIQERCCVQFMHSMSDFIHNFSLQMCDSVSH